ncbi:TetR family transcriptional regulator, partial [Rhodococcus sp. 105337]|uniref:TetR family transcriptional regulator n=1 Tax=Rhodococcus sp. 105337 TaxID=2725310 RepID=UPI00146E0264
MASSRRIGAPDAKNRSVLLDAAEQLMVESGYAAVTSRRVADSAPWSGGLRIGSAVDVVINESCWIL